MQQPGPRARPQGNPGPYFEGRDPPRLGSVSGASRTRGERSGRELVNFIPESCLQSDLFQLENWK